MTKQEFLKIYTLLNVVYDLNFNEHKTNAWYDVFKNWDFAKIMNSANKYIETDRMKPKPADLIRLANELRPKITNQQGGFKCGLCSNGFVLVENCIDFDGKNDPIIFYYRCKCDQGQRNAYSIPSITDSILNNRFRDMFGIYRIEKPVVQNAPTITTSASIGRW